VSSIHFHNPKSPKTATPRLVAMGRSHRLERRYTPEPADTTIRSTARSPRHASDHVAVRTVQQAERRLYCTERGNSERTGSMPFVWSGCRR
jgi:hypothetical protein